MNKSKACANSGSALRRLVSRGTTTVRHDSSHAGFHNGLGTTPSAVRFPSSSPAPAELDPRCRRRNRGAGPPRPAARGAEAWPARAARATGRYALVTARAPDDGLPVLAATGCATDALDADAVRLDSDGRLVTLPNGLVSSGPSFLPFAVDRVETRAQRGAARAYDAPMKRAARTWSIMAIAAGCAMACGSSGSSPPSGAGGTAGTDSGAAGAATGGSSGAGGSSAGGATGDASTSTTVTVIVKGLDGNVLAGVDVVFSNPDGTVASYQTTAANGQASATVAAGSMVTLASKNATTYYLTSVGDVHPGDQIVFSGFGPQQVFTNAGPVTINFPGSQSGADLYLVNDGCNSLSAADPSKPYSLKISNHCLNNNHYDLLAEALKLGPGGTIGTALAASMLLGQSFSANQSVSLPAWSTNFQTTTVSVSDFRTGVASVQGQSNFMLDGNQFQIFYSPTLTAAGTYDARVPAGVTPQAMEPFADVAFNSSGSGHGGTGEAYHNVVGFPSQVSIDLAAELPRTATDGVFDLSDAVRPRLSWTVSGTDTVTDMTLVQVSCSDSGVRRAWQLVTKPQENGPVQLPAMPPALASYAPTSTATYDTPSVSYIAASWVTEGWDRIRKAGGQPTDLRPITGYTYASTGPSFATPP